jgi:hypothetical protein
MSPTSSSRLTPANLDRGHGLLWHKLVNCGNNDLNLRSGDPAQVVKRSGLEVITTDPGAGGR